MVDFHFPRRELRLFPGHVVQEPSSPGDVLKSGNDHLNVRIPLRDGLPKRLLGAGVAMHEAPYLPWLATHATDEVEEALLVGVRGAAGEAVDAGADRVVLPAEDDVAAFGALFLDFPARRSPRLVANEADVVARIAEHGTDKRTNLKECPWKGQERLPSCAANAVWLGKAVRHLRPMNRAPAREDGGGAMVPPSAFGHGRRQLGDRFPNLLIAPAKASVLKKVHSLNGPTMSENSWVKSSLGG